MTPKEPDSKIKLVVGEDESGKRLDVYLAKKAGFISREEAKKAIREGNILVNQHPSKPSYLVRDGDLITGVLPERKSPDETLQPEPIPIDVIFEDDSIIVLNKPAGIVVHPGAGNYKSTLVHALLFHCDRLAPQGSPLRPGIVHRLDKETSGVMVIAKTAEAYSDLVQQFKNSKVEKRYCALVYGRVKEKSGTLETGIQRHPKDRKRMTITMDGGKRAVTQWVVKRWFDEFTLLEIVIKTGRTHQIRAHFSYLGHPVVGDLTYGGRRRAKTVTDRNVRARIMRLRRHLLHAFYLSFMHPRTGERVAFTSSLPGEFREIVDFIPEKVS